MKNGYKVMDSDIHVIEPADLWLKYMEPQYRDRAPQRKHMPAGPDTGMWVFEDKAFPAFGNDPARQRSAQIRRQKARVRHLAAGRYQDPKDDLRGDDPHAMLQAMDIEGIDISIVFRTMGAHVIGIDDLDPKLSAAVCRAFNHWLADFCSVDPTRLKLAGLMPMHDVNLAVEEARRSVEDLGAVTLVLSNHPVNGRTWYDRYYDPFWAEAERLGVPVAFHGIQMAYQEHIGRRYMDNFALAHAVAHPVELMLALGSLLTGGIFERFQGLKAAFLEGHCGWVPSWLYCLDERVEKFGDDERYGLKLSPTEYFQKHCYVSVDPDEAVVRHTIEAVGDENIVISSDWPHDDSAYPQAINYFLAIDKVSEASKKKILWDNCARLYSLH